MEEDVGRRVGNRLGAGSSAVVRAVEVLAAEADVQRSARQRAPGAGWAAVRDATPALREEAVFATAVAEHPNRWVAQRTQKAWWSSVVSVRPPSVAACGAVSALLLDSF